MIYRPYSEAEFAKTWIEIPIRYPRASAVGPDVTVPPPTPNNPIFVSAQIDATTVEIYYVVGFGSTELMLTMSAGDGTYTYTYTCGRCAIVT